MHHALAGALDWSQSLEHAVQTEQQIKYYFFLCCMCLIELHLQTPINKKNLDKYSSECLLKAVFLI